MDAKPRIVRYTGEIDAGERGLFLSLRSAMRLPYCA